MNNYTELEKLKKLKTQLQNQLDNNENFGVNKSLNESIGELSSYDNHPADIGSELFEKSKDLALKDSIVQKIELVDNAINKIKNDTYGICERCGKVIPKERLAIVPETNYCLNCTKEYETKTNYHDRPIEEELLFPGFGKHNYDSSNFETEYDGEDSWQDVEQYGTSNDISMMEDIDSYDDDFFSGDYERETYFHIENDDNQLANYNQNYNNNYDTSLKSDDLEKNLYQNYLREDNDI